MKCYNQVADVLALVKAISLQALLFGEIASVLISCSFSGEGLLC